MWLRLRATTPWDVGGFSYGAFQPDYGAIETELRESGGKQLAALVTNAIHRQVSTETSVRSGQPAFEIIEAAKELPADLVVMSTHGRTGLKHVFLGSVTEHVVRQAPCPVLVVHDS